MNACVVSGMRGEWQCRSGAAGLGGGGPSVVDKRGKDEMVCEFCDRIFKQVYTHAPHDLEFQGHRSPGEIGQDGCHPSVERPVSMAGAAACPLHATTTCLGSGLCVWITSASRHPTNTEENPSAKTTSACMGQGYASTTCEGSLFAHLVHYRCSERLWRLLTRGSCGLCLLAGGGLWSRRRGSSCISRTSIARRWRKRKRRTPVRPPLSHPRLIHSRFMYLFSAGEVPALRLLTG